jgi:hypothetical protein
MNGRTRSTVHTISIRYCICYIYGVYSIYGMYSNGIMRMAIIDNNNHTHQHHTVPYSSLKRLGILSSAHAIVEYIRTIPVVPGQWVSYRDRRIGPAMTAQPRQDDIDDDDDEDADSIPLRTEEERLRARQQEEKKISLGPNGKTSTCKTRPVIGWTFFLSRHYSVSLHFPHSYYVLHCSSYVLARPRSSYSSSSHG